jgi:hypothetical protein
MKEVITDELITAKINATPRDQYGQIQRINCTIKSLFPDRVEEATEFINTKSKKYAIYHYANKYFSYYAIGLKH